MTDFSLIETLRYEPDVEFVRLRLHLARLKRSARRLGFAGAERAQAELQAAVQGATGPLRVRLTLDRNGTVAVTTATFTPLAEDTVWRVRFAQTRLSSEDKLVRVQDHPARHLRDGTR